VLSTVGITQKMIHAYFNYAYNPVYDFVATQPIRYQQLQRTCIDKLELKDHDAVLCVGVGTGNEIYHLLQKNKNINIVGVDLSGNALKRAYRKAAESGKEIVVHRMDAASLDFPTESFDKVSCIHLMDFVRDNRIITEEILRVLKRGGCFVITYPSYSEGLRLGLSLARNHIRTSVDSGKSRIFTILKSLARVPVGIVYLPLMLRPGKKSYTYSELEKMMVSLGIDEYRIEEDAVYNDFIVSGKK
jgi:ubiquinone/menaquinone biosynthesis C-methylase UbiE